jgi:hypothetical protein
MGVSPMADNPSNNGKHVEHYRRRLRKKAQALNTNPET